MINKIKEKVLVTGGAGFIGSHLTDALLAAGYQVNVLDNLVNGSLDRLKEASESPDYAFYQGDILSESDCRKAVQGCSYVFHLACLGVRHSLHSPFENHRVNAEGTLRVLAAALSEGVEHFFYISTSEIYGRTSKFPIDEDAPTKPLTVYGSSKLAGEFYTANYSECYGLNTTVFRIFNNYGPRAHYEGDSGEIIPRTIMKILANEKPIIFGDGNITRDFFFVKDTARVLLQAIGQRNILSGDLLNIGAGREYSMKYLVETLLNRMGKSELGINYMPDRPADVPRLWVDNTKFCRLFGIELEDAFETKIDETIDYYKKMVETGNNYKKLIDINWV